jgi:hypothetical protein
MGFGRLAFVSMTAAGVLVQATSGQWMVRPPVRCPRGHLLRPGRFLVGSIACSCGRHTTWRCECGAVTYGPALAEGCSLLDGPARMRWLAPAYQAWRAASWARCTREVSPSLV